MKLESAFEGPAPSSAGVQTSLAVASSRNDILSAIGPQNGQLYTSASHRCCLRPFTMMLKGDAANGFSSSESRLHFCGTLTRCLATKGSFPETGNRQVSILGHVGHFGKEGQKDATASASVTCASRLHFLVICIVMVACDCYIIMGLVK